MPSSHSLNLKSSRNLSWNSIRNTRCSAPKTSKPWFWIRTSTAWCSTTTPPKDINPTFLYWSRQRWNWRTTRTSRFSRWMSRRMKSTTRTASLPQSTLRDSPYTNSRTKTGRCTIKLRGPSFRWRKCSSSFKNTLLSPGSAPTTFEI